MAKFEEVADKIGRNEQSLVEMEAKHEEEKNTNFELKIKIEEDKKEIIGKWDRMHPHGVGKWKYDDRWNIEGEWKDGLLNGRVAMNSYGDRYEYEAKDGKHHGKYIGYFYRIHAVQRWSSRREKSMEDAEDTASMG